MNVTDEPADAADELHDEAIDAAERGRFCPCRCAPCAMTRQPQDNP